VVDLRGGFGSERDDYGKVLFPGWKDSDLPTEAGNPEGRSYAAIAAGMATQKQAQADACAPAPQAHAHSHAHSHAHPQQHALNRFAHPTKTVQCVKFGRDLPALKRVPMGGEIGKRIFDNVSADAWQLWVEHSKMIINEYRLNPAEAKAQELLVKQCEDFFFGEGAKLPEGYVPQAMAK
jgi:Fe-S cluster biosynthesis and repair protein YggX